MTNEEKKKLESLLWNIANTLRGKMSADEFRDYILGFIFYKYLSEKFEKKLNKTYLTNEKFEDLSANDKKKLKKSVVEDIGYYIEQEHLFSYVAHKAQNNAPDVLDLLPDILQSIENSTKGSDSEDDFDSLFSDLDLDSQKLGRTHSERNNLISKIIGELNRIDFKLDNNESDILGDAYEYLIAQFASGAGKKAGEFYTPQEVSTILARIVTTDRKQLKSVYDPTCGSGSLLLRVSKCIGVDKVEDFYGQESNHTTYNLARMNMILHGVRYDKFDIKHEDTLKKPQHRDLGFEAIVANPPFSAHWQADMVMKNDDRFYQYGKLAPTTKADYAFIQHMIHQLADNGQMAVVVPHGVLFRGASEGHIRQYIIEQLNYLDAVIGLPANIFYGTSIPTVILVFKKCRRNDEDILFIDASKNFEKQKNQNKLRDEDIDEIINTYQERKEIEKYSHIAKMDEIIENEYNLNIPRYVDTFEEEEQIDIEKVAKALKQLDIDLKQDEDEIARYCTELGIDTPF